MADTLSTVPISWSNDPDDALMERLRGGDGRALDVLISRHAAKMSHFFYRLTGDADAVDDLLQDLFLRVYASRESWSPTGGFAAWLYTIARRLVYDRSRTRRRKPLHRAGNRYGPVGGTTTLLGKIPDDAPTPFGSLSRLETALKLDQALRQVPEPFREAVVLCDLQHLSYEDAARILDCPVKTLSTRLARGRERLRELLAPYFALRESP